MASPEFVAAFKLWEEWMDEGEEVALDKWRAHIGQHQLKHQAGHHDQKTHGRRGEMTTASAVGLLTENSPINIDLRKQRELDEVSQDIVDALDKGMKPAESDMVLYRGVKLQSAEQAEAVYGTSGVIKPGHEFDELGYASTSTNMSIARKFAGNDGTVIRVHVKQGQPILDTAGLSNWPGEREVLLPRGSKFKVTGFEYDERTDTLFRDVDVLKQLPLDEASKETLINIRMELFYDTSDRLAEQVFAGDISIGQWQESMKSLIREARNSTAAIGKGGWDQMGPRDWGRLGTPNREQYKYLKGFANKIADDADDISLSYIKNRARMYGDGIVDSAVQAEAGFWFEDHLPWLPKDGSTSCLGRCHCKWVLRIVDSQPTFNTVEAIWQLGEAEHCVAADGKDGCVDRAGHTELLKVPQDVSVPPTIGGY